MYCRNGSFDVTEDAQFAALHTGENVPVGNELAGNVYDVIENGKNLAQIIGNASVSPAAVQGN